MQDGPAEDGPRRNSAFKKPLPAWSLWIVLAAGVLAVAGALYVKASRELGTGLWPGDVLRAARNEARYDADGRAGELAKQGLDLREEGRYGRALKRFHQSLAIAERHRLRSRAACCLQNIAVTNELLGRLDSARKYYALSYDACRKVKNRWIEVTALTNMGIFQFDKLGDLDSGRVLLEKSLSLARDIGCRRGQVTALINLASLCFQQGLLDSARVLSEHAAALSRSAGDEEEEERNSRAAMAAREMIARREPRLAELAQRVRELRRRGEPKELLDVLQDFAFEMLLGGDYTGARAALAEARTLTSQADAETAPPALARLEALLPRE